MIVSSNIFCQIVSRDNTNLLEQPSQTLQGFLNITQSLDSILNIRFSTVNNAFQYDEKQHFLYDNQNNLISLIFFDGINSGSEWRNSEKLEFYYNSQNYNTSIIEYSWELESLTWFPYIKLEYTFNNLGEITSTIYYYNSSEIISWQQNHKIENTYDLNGNETLNTTYIWNSTMNQWEYSSKTVRSYNNNSLTSITELDWSTTNSMWINSEKKEYDYDAFGNLTISTSFNWLSSSSEWRQSFKEVRTFNENNLCTQMINYSWVSATTVWKANSMYEYNYDNLDNQTSQIRSVFDETLESFVYYHKTENTFNYNYTLDVTAYPLLYEEDLSIFKSQVIKTMEYDWNNEASNWNNTSYLDLYYSGIGNNLNDNSDSQASVYPNPTSDFIIIEDISAHKLSNVKIFDLWGNMVIEKSFVVQTKIPVKNLSSGVYYIYVNKNSYSKGVKLVKI